jgi:hypothetical protein
MQDERADEFVKADSRQTTAEPASNVLVARLSCFCKNLIFSVESNHTLKAPNSAY